MVSNSNGEKKSGRKQFVVMISDDLFIFYNV